MEDRGAASSEKISSHLPRHHFYDGAFQMGECSAAVCVRRTTETHQRRGGSESHLPCPRFVWLLEVGSETSGHFNRKRVGGGHGSLLPCRDSLVDRAFLPSSDRNGNQCCISFHGESNGLKNPILNMNHTSMNPKMSVPIVMLLNTPSQYSRYS